MMDRPPDGVRTTGVRFPPDRAKGARRQSVSYACRNICKGGTTSGDTVRRRCYLTPSQHRSNSNTCPAAQKYPL